MKAQANKKLKKSQRTLKDRGVTLLAITLIAAVGAYLVFKSQAATYSFRKEGTQIGANQVLVKFFVNLPAVNAPSHLQFRLENNQNTDADHDYGCLDISQYAGKGDSEILSKTVTFNGPIGDAYLNYDYWFFNSACYATSPTGGSYTSHDPLLGSGGIYQGSVPDPDQGQQPCTGSGCTGGGGGGGNGDTSGQTGTTTGQTGRGNGPSGGSGGSSATKQTNQTNTVPTSSSQGTNEQTKLEPSPFFDGKEYKPGSDQDSLSSTFAKVGGVSVKRWFLIPLFIIIMGIATAGYIIWRKKRQA